MRALGWILIALVRSSLSLPSRWQMLGGGRGPRSR
jgi:hypothetical protein